MPNKKMKLKISMDDEDVAYLTLPDHPGQGTAGCVSKQVRLLDLIQYNGPDLYFDFDEADQLIGVEILV